MGKTTSRGPTETARTLITEIQEAHNTTYELWAELAPCDRPQGMMELRFQSRWSGARNPSETQDRGRFMLDAQAKQRLCQLLQSI